MTTKTEVREVFKHFDPYFSSDVDPYFSSDVVAMFERACWKRRRHPTMARLFLLTLPINLIKNVQQRALVLPAVEPC